MQNVFRSSTFAAFYEIITSQNKNYPDKLILFFETGYIWNIRGNIAV